MKRSAKKRALMQVPVAQCISLRASTQALGLLAHKYLKMTELQTGIVRITVDSAMDF